MFIRKKKQYSITKKAFEMPFKYRFTFVPEGCSYYEGFTVQISEKIIIQKKAFFIASEVFCRDYSDKALKGVAVFYGDVESPDCNDKLYGAYNSFYKNKRR